MNEREEGFKLEQAAHTPVALVDADGRLHGWSPAFADACTLTAAELRAVPISDIWPELGDDRWAEFWIASQAAPGSVIVQVQERSAKGNGEVELEISRFIFEGVALAKVEIRRAALWRLHLMQQELLQAMALGMPLKAVMEALCRKVEALAPSVICSILEVDRQQRLRHIASPSLPQHYIDAIDGLLIGPTAGSCGTAAFRAEAVEITDIGSDPLWEDFRHLALPLGLRACWSSPIKSSDGRVLGAFAFYYPRSRGPTLLERQIVSACLHMCMLALEHEETRSQAYQYAYTDPLTQLANRARFQQRVGESLAIVAETGQRVAILYIGLDRFRATNEILGYAAGDELLKMVARRLSSLVKDPDAVARIGGDEFALIQVGDFKDEEVANRARGIVELLAEPFMACSHRVELSASVGIALGPDDAGDADHLMQDAALAMRRVKEVGRCGYIFYEKELNERMQRRRRAEADLRLAVTQNQFELYFQPIFNLRTGAIEMAEALLRWNHPQRGKVPPSEFIPLAEQCGLIEQVGTWVIREACLAAARWPSQISVAVNLSPLQFDGPLIETVNAALKESNLDPSRLELEITESVLLRDSPVNTAILDQLSDLGVSIALDDFGAGYSSLSYLHRFSFDRVKIDHSFIRDIARNDGSLKIVRAIVMLAHSLGLKVTAEGVESDEQLAAVRGEGCDSVQGYYTGAPGPISSFLERLNQPSMLDVTAA